MITTEKYDGAMRILCAEGDRRIVWRNSSLAEINEAKKTFREALASGHLAFRTQRGGSKSEKITEFDPAAEEIILVPMIKGG